MPNKNHVFGGEEVALLVPEVFSGRESLPAETCLEIYRHMVRSRAMEERMIKMSKSGQGYFWIGGPGEEAFNVGLGLQIKKGHGPSYDYLHLHYRNSATLVAMGMPLIDGIRQMAMTATDTFSRGRNFAGHFAHREWNILPISSVIEVQYAMAPGTALVQKRHGGDGITIVTGGDAGFCGRRFRFVPGVEQPAWSGIAGVDDRHQQWLGHLDDRGSQHGEKHIIDRGKAFGIRGEVVDGNDPIASWHAIHRAMDYCRNERRPFMLEATVSRLYGHSSSSGAQRVQNESDNIVLFEQKLLKAGILDAITREHLHEEAAAEVEAAVEQMLEEPMPKPADVEKYTYAPSSVDVVYPEDYTGLPV